MVQQMLPEKPQMSQKRHLPKINKHPDQTQAAGPKSTGIASGAAMTWLRPGENAAFEVFPHDLSRFELRRMP
jgi:hypothetical protein